MNNYNENQNSLHFFDLPIEIIAYDILPYISEDKYSIINFMRVCKRFNEIGWKYVNFKMTPEVFGKIIENNKYYINVTNRLLENVYISDFLLSGQAITTAIHLRFYKVVELFLKDPRVDPSGSNNELIRFASINGYYELVELLLKDLRVDPSDEDNYSIQVASEKGHMK
jgi:hypothetical protein